MKKELVFGFHAVKAMLQKRPENILQLYLQEERDDKRSQFIRELAQHHSILVQTISKTKLDQWSEGKRHQGVLVEAKHFTAGSEKELLELLKRLNKPPFLLILDEIQDPHNLGACLRSANAAGVDAVIITQNRTANITPIVRKIAAGAVETTTVITVTNLANALRQLKNQGIWIYGLDGTAKQSLYLTSLTGPLGFVLGAEGKGLRRLTKECCDSLVAIPMQGTVESLNVSVTAGICLFEAQRQREYSLS